MSCSARAFEDVLNELRGNMTLSELSKRTIACDEEARGVSGGYLSLVSTGAQRPAVRAMILIAAALEVDPQVFVEYRLAAARAALDERNDGGLEAAFSLLERIEGAVGTVASENVLLKTRKLAA